MLSKNTIRTVWNRCLFISNYSSLFLVLFLLYHQWNSNSKVKSKTDTPVFLPNSGFQVLVRLVRCKSFSTLGAKFSACTCFAEVSIGNCRLRQTIFFIVFLVLFSICLFFFLIISNTWAVVFWLHLLLEWMDSHKNQLPSSEKCDSGQKENTFSNFYSLAYLVVPNTEEQFSQPFLGLSKIWQLFQDPIII